jgi:hypothetical protein
MYVWVLSTPSMLWMWVAATSLTSAGVSTSTFAMRSTSPATMWASMTPSMASISVLRRSASPVWAFTMM